MPHILRPIYLNICVSINYKISRMAIETQKRTLKNSNILKIRMLDILSGERGIRTPGTLRYDGFQDRCNRPLCHLSNRC